METNNKQEQNMIDLEEIDVVIRIPKNSARIRITVDVFENDEQLSVHRILNPADIFQARQDFIDLVGDEDVYELTDRGKKLASEL